MASPSAPVHPARYLSFFLVLLVGAYLLVFFTGDRQAKPKLGIDLQGGTRVTLTARTPDGSAPTREALNQAQQIISDRVNGLGVSGLRGRHRRRQPGDHGARQRRQRGPQPGPDRAAVHPPGDPRDAGPARRSRRPPSRRAAPPARRRAPDPAHRRLSLPRPAGRAGPVTPRRPNRHRRRQTPAPQPRPYPQEPPPTPAPTAHAGPARAPGTPPPQRAADLAQRIADEKQLRQSTDQQIQLLALQFQATRCDEDDVLAGNDDPNLPLVTCSTDDTQVYLLDKSIISGEQIENATSGLDQQRGEYVVDLQFKGDAANVWADFTAANVGTQTAFVLDSQVVSAPEIQEAIPGRPHPDHRPVHRRLGTRTGQRAEVRFAAAVVRIV